MSEAAAPRTGVRRQVWAGRARAIRAARRGHGHRVAAQHGRREGGPRGRRQALGTPARRRSARSSSQMVMGAAMNQVE